MTAVLYLNAWWILPALAAWDLSVRILSEVQ